MFFLIHRCALPSCVIGSVCYIRIPANHPAFLVTSQLEALFHFLKFYKSSKKASCIVTFFKSCNQLGISHSNRFITCNYECSPDRCHSFGFKVITGLIT